MITDRKQLTVEISPRFHTDVKAFALKRGTTVKQIVLEALVQYMNQERGKDDSRN